MVPQKMNEAASQNRQDAVPGELEARQRQSEFMDRLAGKVVDWGMAVPAIFMLESTRPLSFVGSQVLVFFRPIVDSLFAFRSYDAFAEMLDDRRNIDYLLSKIEELESARIKDEKKQRQENPRRLPRFWKRR